MGSSRLRGLDRWGEGLTFEGLSWGRLDLPRQYVISPGDLQEARLQTRPTDLDSSLAHLKSPSSIMGSLSFGIIRWRLWRIIVHSRSINK